MKLYRWYISILTLLLSSCCFIPHFTYYPPDHPYQNVVYLSYQTQQENSLIKARNLSNSTGICPNAIDYNSIIYAIANFSKKLQIRRYFLYHFFAQYLRIRQKLVHNCKFANQLLKSSNLHVCIAQFCDLVCRHNYSRILIMW